MELAILLGDGLPQTGQPGIVSVKGVAVGQRLNGSVLDILRRWLVRLAKIEF
jgi:hypothetical protein